MWPVFAQLMAECRQAHWRHLANTTELVLPWAHPSLQPKQQIDWFNRFCTAYNKMSLYFTMGTAFDQNCAFLWGGSGFPSNLWFLGPISAHIPKGISNGSAIFAQLTAECPCSLRWAPLSPKNCAFAMGGESIQLMIPCASPSPQSKNSIMIGWAVFAQMTTECSSVPILYNGLPLPPQNCPSCGDVVLWVYPSPQTKMISRSVFAGLTTVTDSPTDHATRSVTIGCICSAV